jgi:two-component system, chemotaxis family, CheB/CheR fusion protein
MGELHQEVVEYLVPPSVLINEQYDIEHISARAGRYLRFSGGEPTRNLLKVVHPELRSDLHAALLQAHAGSRSTVETRRLRLNTDGEGWVRMTVRSVTYRPEAARGFYLVAFDEAGPESGSAEGADSDADHGIAHVETIRLEEELRNTQEKLRITVEQYETSIEELRASNEELQAMNEELRSATEELETSKEELQSVNEELTTVNQEYREKIEEVGRANSDLQNLMASTDIGTIFLNRALQIQRYTPSIQRLFNITAADIRRPLEHFTHKLDYDSLAGDAQQVLRTLLTLEREVCSSDGSWFLARLLPYRTLDDRIDGVVVTFVDITARRQAEEQLREQAARLREQADIVNLGDLMVRDADDRIVLWSAGCELLYGYTNEEAVGKNGHQLLKTEFPQPLENINAELQTHGEWQGELVHATSSGKRIMVASRWVLYRPESRPPLVLQINNDITDRRLAEEALRQADRNKDQFLATLAHELRNPLSAMMSSIELLRRPAKTTDEIERARELLQRQIRHLLRLVDDLLDVERLAHGKIGLQKKRVPLTEIVETAMQICRPLLDPSSHRFTVVLPPDPLFLEVDPERIAQVLANLVHNAFKYTPAGGRIELVAQAEGSEVAVRVTDTGIGISADAVPRIFDMYTQGEKVPGTGLKGLGVGLALVRQLVELHGGRVAAYSEGLQKGSEFVVHLPLATPPSAWHKQPATGSARAHTPLQGRKILIVDDHRDAADALHALLESSGHQVATSYNGAAGLDSAKSFQPEVVVLDIGLPDISGYDVARQLREILPDVTLIALSGWLPEENIEQARQAGFNHYLTKPVQFGELNKLLSNG